MRYDELLSSEPALTGEDFIKAETFRPHLESIRSEHPGLDELELSQLRGTEPKVVVIRRWLQRGGLESDDVRSALESLKERLFNALKPSHIEDKYFKALEELATKLPPP